MGMKTLKIAIVTMFFVGIATFVIKPAQAEFGLMGGYKYVSFASAQYDAHVFQVDIMFTVPKGKGYREEGKRPYGAVSVAMAIGTDGTDDSSFYFALPFAYKHVFSNGLGISAGMNIPLMESNSGNFGIGIGFSDLGVSYHFKNGLTLYGGANIGYARFFPGENSGIIWGAGAGIGSWF